MQQLIFGHFGAAETNHELADASYHLELCSFNILTAVCTQVVFQRQNPAQQSADFVPTLPWKYYERVTHSKYIFVRQAKPLLMAARLLA